MEAISRIKKIDTKLPIIVLSMHTSEEYVREALRVGASGYVIKGADPSELELAVKSAMRGEIYLSPAISKSIVSHFLKQNPDEFRGEWHTGPSRPHHECLIVS